MSIRGCSAIKRLSGLKVAPILSARVSKYLSMPSVSDKSMQVGVKTITLVKTCVDLHQLAFSFERGLRLFLVYLHHRACKARTMEYD